MIGSLESLAELWFDMNTISVVPEVCTFVYDTVFAFTMCMCMYVKAHVCCHVCLVAHTHTLLCIHCPVSITCVSNSVTIAFSLSLFLSLSQEIGNLRNLRFLELSENHVMILPETIGQLVNLTDLYLNDNLLTFLPETLGDLHNLVYLRLDNNRLGNLPDTLDGYDDDKSKLMK